MTTPAYVSRPFQREPDFGAVSVHYHLDELLVRGRQRSSVRGGHMRARSFPKPATVDERIAQMTEVIVREFHPEQIILFGSQARRNADVRSDVDLLVVMPDDADRRRTAIAITQAVSDIPVAKDIVVTTPAEIAQRGHVVGSVLRPALREGRTLYSRS